MQPPSMSRILISAHTSNNSFFTFPRYFFVPYTLQELNFNLFFSTQLAALNIYITNHNIYGHCKFTEGLITELVRRTFPEDVSMDKFETCSQSNLAVCYMLSKIIF